MSAETIRSAVLAYDQALAVAAVHQALSDGDPVDVILNQGLIGAMEELGEKFSQGILFVPEMLLGAMTMKAGLEALKPTLVTNNTNQRPHTVVIGTVKGDQHDVGKNLVALMLEGGGFNVVDIGVNQSKENFLAAARQHGADVIALSSLLTTTMPAMEETVDHLRSRSNGIKIIVGGSPVSQSFADRIGADGYGEHGYAAVELAKSLVRN